MSYQSLYRRYRPGKFAEVRGQEHLVTALRNAVREDRVGHAYLFSGPRGTGKTTTARILAKALNCPDLTDGEPCGVCESCLAIEKGTSFDVHELDAASNNKVEDIRDLISKIALGTPGRNKVYILDEVHMLTAQASNALLKTLEEPPANVVFVLATTDPQKVLATIRSRTQHYDVHLLPSSELRALADHVVADAGLDVAPEAVEHAVRAGAGSARDMLSALEQVAAAGGVDDDIEAVDELVEALCEQDTGRALIAVEQAVVSGRSPRLLGELLISRLRDVFLASMKADLRRLPDRDLERVTDQASRMGAATVTRAIEALGDAFVGINDAPDPRIPLEVALVRLTKPEADTSIAALLARIERLERNGVGNGSAGDGGVEGAQVREGRAADRPPSREAPPRRPDRPSPAPASAAAPADRPSGPAAKARQALSGTRSGDDAGGPRAASEPDRGSAPAARQPAPRTPPPARGPGPRAAGPASAKPEPPTGARAAVAAAPGGPVPSKDELTVAWGDNIVPGLPTKVRSRFAGGRWLDSDSDAGQVRYGLPNPPHLKRCEDVRAAAEQALTAHFGRSFALKLVIDEGAVDPPGSRDRGRSSGGAGSRSGSSAEDAVSDDGPDEAFDPNELEDAHDVATTSVDRITAVFDGAELVTDE